MVDVTARGQIADAIRAELLRQADESGAMGLWFDPDYLPGKEEPRAKIDGYLDLTALSEAVAAVCIDQPKPINTNDR